MKISFSVNFSCCLGHRPNYLHVFLQDFLSQSFTQNYFISPLLTMPLVLQVSCAQTSYTWYYPEVDLKSWTRVPVFYISLQTDHTDWKDYHLLKVLHYSSIPHKSFPKLNIRVCIWVWQTIPLNAHCWPLPLSVCFAPNDSVPRTHNCYNTGLLTAALTASFLGPPCHHRHPSLVI